MLELSLLLEYRYIIGHSPSFGYGCTFFQMVDGHLLSQAAAAAATAAAGRHSTAAAAAGAVT